jgi:hypothetical protein
MKEYGSNIAKLVEHLVSIPDIDKRTKHAHILIELMRQIHPQMRDGADYSKKLWDDLYIMANFDLEVDSPFPPPPKEILGKRPAQIPYTQNRLRHRFYGRNVEILVLKAMMADTFEERKAFVSYLVKLMKSFFLNWNKDTIETPACLNQILELSGGKLKAEIDDLRANGLIEDANPKDGSGFRQKQPSQSYNTRPDRGGERGGNERRSGNSRPFNSRSGPPSSNNKNRFNNNRRRPQ